MGTENKIGEMLFELRDEDYAAFQAKLTPNVDSELFIGVRVPEARKLAKKLENDPAAEIFFFKLFIEDQYQKRPAGKIESFSGGSHAVIQFGKITSRAT